MKKFNLKISPINFTLPIFKEYIKAFDTFSVIRHLRIFLNVKTLNQFIFRQLQSHTHKLTMRIQFKHISLSY